MGIITFIENEMVITTTFFCAIYFHFKVKALKINKTNVLYIVSILTALPICCLLVGGYDYFTIKLIFILLMCICVSILDWKHIYSSIPIAIISVAVAFCLEYIGVFVVALSYFLGNTSGNIITTLISCIIQILLCILISRINRIKKAFNYLDNKDNFGIGLLISSYVLIFSLILTQHDKIKMDWGIILLAGSPLVLVGLILWIRSIVDRYYKRKIADRADAFTQQELKEKDEKIERLEAEVATLAKQLHRDNHLLSSLDRSAQMLVTTDSAQEREKLVDEIHTLYRERNDMITKDQQANKLLPSTDISLIDGALSDMYVKATAHGINFDLIVSEPIHYLVNNIISQTDLQTLLCDHIKDAIIAIDAADITNGKILVTIEKNEGIFEISIRDNGVDFELDTLAKLGIERVTTHADDGGSGIGFMTTFETLAKTKGSLIITEYENRTPFTKAVIFNFDGLHRFIISSYRKEELKEKISRDDIIYL